VRGTGDLETRIAQAASQAEERLAEVSRLSQQPPRDYRWWGRLEKRRKEDLEPARNACAETLRGIAEERERIQADLALLRTYRTDLLGLGSRSFQIRVQRTLDAERLEAAYDDVGRTLTASARWATFQGEEHAGTFASRHAVQLLACLGVLVASLLFVRFGRRGLDRLLRHRASQVPSLRSEPITVRAEEAQARRERAVQEAAARAAEEEALRQVSKEEAARPQKMGEGGYGGEDDS